jgi:hypothetical protein
MKVEVRDVPVEPEPEPHTAAPDSRQLQARLQTIEQRLRLLEQRLLQSVETP